MLLRYPDPDRLAGVWAYGPETEEDSDSDLTPRCEICEGPVTQQGWCDKCEVFNDATA